MNFWIFISDNTGMPLGVQKCDFQPTISPLSTVHGKWVRAVLVPEDGHVYVSGEESSEKD